LDEVKKEATKMAMNIAGLTDEQAAAVEAAMQLADPVRHDGLILAVAPLGRSADLSRQGRGAGAAHALDGIALPALRVVIGLDGAFWQPMNGHHRAAASQLCGFSHVPCIVLSSPWSRRA
jgi:hypothetical protein